MRINLGTEYFVVEDNGVKAQMWYEWLAKYAKVPKVYI